MKSKHIVIGLVILAVLIGLWYNGYLGSAPASQQHVDFDYSQEVTGLTAGATLNDNDPDNIIITVTNGTIASQADTNISFNLRFLQEEGVQDNDKPKQVELRAVAYKFDNVVDTSDTASYDTVQYTTSEGYAITVGGKEMSDKDVIFKRNVDYDAYETVWVDFQINPGSDLDKAVENAFDEVILARVNGNGGKSVTLKYVKTE